MDRYWRELDRLARECTPPDIQFRSALPSPPPASSQRAPRLRRFYEKYVRYPIRVRGAEGDIIHLLDHSYAHLLPLLPRDSIKISTVFDLVPLEDRSGLSDSQVSRFRKTVENLRYADHLVSISNETKRKLTEVLGIPAEKISVAVPGTNIESFQTPVPATNGIRKKLAALPPVIFSVGAFVNRKNLQSVPAIFRKMEPMFRAKRCCFVRAGAPISDALKKEIVSVTGPDGFIELGPLFGDDLIAAYQSSRILLFPSTLEGLTFVIPEAMAAGCTVVTNTMTANPEAGGDAALYYTEGDAAEAAEKLVSLLTDDTLYSELKRRGSLRAQQWTWNRHYDHLIEIYRTLLGHLPR